MTSRLRNDVEAIYRAAIESVAPAAAIQRVVSLVGDTTRIGDQRVPTSSSGIYAIAIGKAACQMTDGLLAALGDRLLQVVAVTKAMSAQSPLRTRVLLGSHPIPDERSLDAGREILAFARDIPAGAMVFCLISGGGSSLAEVLRPHVTLPELRKVTDDLLRGGASISEMNAVRSRLSALKGGGLLAALSHTRVVNLIVSDVLGDDPQSIASGPTVLSTNSISAEDVLARYGIVAQLPDDVPADAPAPLATLIVASVGTAVNAAATEAERLGYPAHVISRTVDAEARDAGRMIASIVADTVEDQTSFARPCCILAGGETVVHVRGKGTGGRNTEAALAAAVRLQGVSDCAIAFLATDGDDGSSGAAGGIIDGDTINTDVRCAALDALADSDSFPFLAERCSVLITGPTGTNVNDLMIALIR